MSNPTTTEPRKVDHTFLTELVKWTYEASMFESSPEGRAFGQEMREVIHLAREGINHGA